MQLLIASQRQFWLLNSRKERKKISRCVREIVKYVNDLIASTNLLTCVSFSNPVLRMCSQKVEKITSSSELRNDE